MFLFSCFGLFSKKELKTTPNHLWKSYDSNSFSLGGTVAKNKLWLTTKKAPKNTLSCFRWFFFLSIHATLDLLFDVVFPLSCNHLRRLLCCKIFRLGLDDKSFLSRCSLGLLLFGVKSGCVSQQDNNENCRKQRGAEGGKKRLVP